MELRIRELTEYIKNSNERVNNDKRKYEEEIRKLTVTN